MNMSVAQLNGYAAKLKERLTGSPITYRVAKGAFWSLIGSISSRILAMITSILVARLLGKESYGEVGMVQSTVGIFCAFAGFGLGNTATKYIAEFCRRDHAKAGRILDLTTIASIFSGGLMMFIYLSISPWVAQKSLNNPQISLLLKEGSLLLLFSTLGGVQYAVLIGFESFKQIARINVIQGVTAAPIAFVCIRFFNLHGAIASFTITACLGLLLSAIAVENECDSHGIPRQLSKSFLEEKSVLWKLAAPSMSSGLMLSLTMWIGNAILVNQASGYAELGLYIAASQWGILIAFIPGLLTSVMLPILSETYGYEDKSDFIRALLLNLKAIWLISLPLTIIFSSLSGPLSLLFGKNYYGSERIIPYVMVSLFLSAINCPIGSALLSSGKMWIGTLMNLIWAMSTILFSIILVPEFGGLGLALAYLFGYLLHTILQVIYLEIRLVPGFIHSQFSLLLYTCMIIGGSVGINILGLNSFSLSGILILASSVPLFISLKTLF